MFAQRHPAPQPQVTVAWRPTEAPGQMQALASLLFGEAPSAGPADQPADSGAES
jgi:hypothetical protein